MDTTGNVTITGDLVVNDVNIITEIGTKQDEIDTDTDLTTNSITTKSLTTTENVTISGDLVVNDVNIITGIGTKQDEIDTDTDLTSNSLTTNNILSETFDTIVIRRPSGFSGDGSTPSSYAILLNEI